jgi:Tfp pilus assembly protein PilO
MIRKVALMALGGLVVVIAVWFGLFWRPEGSHLSALVKEQSQAQTHVDQLVGQLDALKALQLKTPGERAALSKLEQAVPEGPSLDQLLDSLNRSALDAGVSLTSVSTPTPAGWAGSSAATGGGSGGGPQSLNLSISVTGTNAQVLRFVNVVESASRLFVVDNFSLSGPTQAAKGQPAAGATSMNIQAFYISAASGDPASLFSAPGGQG